MEELEHLDQWLQRTLAEIPPHRRHLVTTHDGYGYLAAAYGLDVAGFVSPNPAIEPSPRDLIALDRTLRGLKVPAVFSPREATRPGTLTQIAHDQGIRICQIHGDAFTEDIDSYIDLMTANAVEIHIYHERPLLRPTPLQPATPPGAGSVPHLQSAH